ncbi:hypothetical protein B0T10DRAFT_608606 [Thelonectria olida]|uniref:Uncharacterized protein n=1 Tax=Thelonectria olida TaxID=1576542 RepID=A0A9P8VYX9_9HYPO|nr:hypothetical protein B0T10DRAFT_608606 [Thelonectria olida]
MSNADPQNTPAEATDVSSTRPAWLAFLEKKIEEDREEYFADETHDEIVRDVLLAPDDDDTVIAKAIERFMHQYITGDANEHLEMRKPPEYDAGGFLNNIASIIYETAVHVPFTDIGHDRLADLLIGIKSNAAEEYRLEAPAFVYYGWGLEVIASEWWNQGQVDGSLRFRDAQDASEACKSWINTSALMAKLFRGGMLDADGPRWIFGDLKDAFEKRTKGDIATNVGRQAQVLVTVNHILIAGETLVKEVKAPSKKWFCDLSAEKWKFWASKFQEAADAVGENTRWGLKSRAQEAHDKMVKLYPEAFEEKPVEESA